MMPYLHLCLLHAANAACCMVAAAAQDTVHFMHSMNWVKDVFGACYMDYTMKMGRGPELEKVSEMNDWINIGFRVGLGWIGGSCAGQ